ncbi:MAG TPA: hypothetical protein VGE38_14480 [Nocardioides sp.]|uniref:hypothetical protein n=1 Tax=Nocardioides sp. TaxID=35761 RepID=UPI002ED8CEB3
MRLARLTAVGAAAAGLALIAAPANAFTVSNSGGSNSITGTAKGNTTLTANGQVLTCQTSSVSGTVNPGSSNPIGNITSASWNTCDWNGYPATVTVTNPNWSLNYDAASGTATSAANDNAVAGTITNISNVLVSIQGPNGTCTFNVSGSVNATFDEDNGKGGQEITVLSTGSGLTVSNRQTFITCAGLVNNGNTATFSGSYNLNTTAGQINVQP